MKYKVDILRLYMNCWHVDLGLNDNFHFDKNIAQSNLFFFSMKNFLRSSKSIEILNTYF